MAVSLEIDAHRADGEEGADYGAARAFTRQFAQILLESRLPYDVHALNINVPSQATTQTPWWLTRLSRHRYFEPLPPDRAHGQARPGFRLPADPERTEVDSDIWAVLVDHVVSVTPLPLDLTSRLDLGTLHTWLRGDSCARFDTRELWPLPLTDPRPLTVS
jgi:5'-nucleotidase